MFLSYFTEQPMSTYPEDEGLAAGFTSVLFSNKFFDPVEGSRLYRERLADIVVMATPDGTRAAAEFIVHGTYLRAEEGLPPAHIFAVSGKADTQPLFPDDPSLSANRRVTITLMREDPALPPDLKP